MTTIQMPYTNAGATCMLEVPCKTDADLYRLADAIDPHFRNNWKPIDPRRWAALVKATAPK